MSARRVRAEATHGLVTEPVSERVAALLRIAERIFTDGDEAEQEQCSRAAAAVERLAWLVVYKRLGWRRTRSWHRGPGSHKDGGYWELPAVQGWFDHHYRLDVPATDGHRARRIYVSEPYGLDADDLRALVDFTAQYDVGVDARSLHFPGSTLRVTFERRPKP